jgi:hypothetical protein
LQPLATVLGYTAAELKAAKHFPLEMLGIGAVLAIAGCIVVGQQLRGHTAPSAAAIALEPALPLTNDIAGEVMSTTVTPDEPSGAGDRTALS